MNGLLPPASDSRPSWVFTGSGAVLGCYRFQADTGQLERVSERTLPAKIQYATFDPQRRLIYVAVSDAGSGVTGAPGRLHQLHTFSLDTLPAAPRVCCEPFTLPERPIHLALDTQGTALLIAFNRSGSISRVALDTLGCPRNEPVTALSAGIFTHQVLPAPGGRYVIALSRGNAATAECDEERGSIHLYQYRAGALVETGRHPCEPQHGPRHLAFHPVRPWLYVAMERGNALRHHHLDEQGEPVFPAVDQVPTLRDAEHGHLTRQKGGCLACHPNGRHLYVSNRSDIIELRGGRPELRAGENTIAVFALDQITGAPRLIQQLDSGGVEPRCLAIDASGRWLIVGNQLPAWLPAEARYQPANLSFFRIDEDGRLAYHGQHQLAAYASLFWLDVLPA
ncbi:MAG: beta-propeller fold lactonase family protein [Pseudomonas oryzihabitans]